MRKARVKADSGVYHVFLRAAAGRSFLSRSGDAELFLDALKAECDRDAAAVFAYCIAGDKIHLVIKEGLEGVTATLMRICRAFSLSLNSKYNSDGKLFYGRFLSEPLETPESILDCTRFIHRLPLEFNDHLNYPYSSYRYYFVKNDLLASDEITALIGSQIAYRLYCDLAHDGKFLGGTTGALIKA
jgi:REP element-mobilizing transposase RayT